MRHRKLAWAGQPQTQIENNFGFSIKKVLDKNSLFYGVSSIMSMADYIGVVTDYIHMLPTAVDKPIVKKIKMISFTWEVLNNIMMYSAKSESSSLDRIEFGASESIIYDIMKKISEPDEIVRSTQGFPNPANISYRYKIGKNAYIYWSIQTQDDTVKSVHVTKGLTKDVVIDFLWSKIGKTIQLDTVGNEVGYVKAELNLKKIFGSSSTMIDKMKTDYLHFFENKMSRSYLLIGKPGTGKTGIVNSIVSTIDGRAFIISGLDGLSIESLESLSVHMTPDFIIFDDCDRSVSTPSFIRSTLKMIETIKDKNPHTMFLFTANSFDGILRDSAVTRKGRIDQIYEIPEPDNADRKEIIQKYAAEFNVALSEHDLQTCIDRSEGMTGADLKELCIQLQRSTVDQCFEQAELVDALKEKYRPDTPYHFEPDSEVSAAPNPFFHRQLKALLK